MPNFAYLRDTENLAKLAQVSASSEDANYPATNAIVLPVSQAWRSAEGKISGIKYFLTFGHPVTLNTVSLVNHNLLTSSTLTLRGGSSADPDGSQFSIPIPWSARTATLFMSGAAQTWRYWSILLTDESNDMGFLQIGYVAAGVRAALPFNFAPEWQQPRTTSVRRIENEIGVPMIGNVLSKARRTVISFTGRNDSERKILDEFLLTLGRESIPLLLTPNPDSEESYFGRLVSDHAIGRFASRFADAQSIEFAEDPHGMIVREPPLFHYEP